MLSVSRFWSRIFIYIRFILMCFCGERWIDVSLKMRLVSKLRILIELWYKIPTVSEYFHYLLNLSHYRRWLPNIGSNVINNSATVGELHHVIDISNIYSSFKLFYNYTAKQKAFTVLAEINYKQSTKKNYENVIKCILFLYLSVDLPTCIYIHSGKISVKISVLIDIQICLYPFSIEHLGL